MKTQLIYIFLSHLLLILITGIILITVLPIAFSINYKAGVILITLLSLYLIVNYQRICNILNFITDHLGISNQVAKELPDYYVVSLTISTAISLFVLLYTLDGILWFNQNESNLLATPYELPLNNNEGLYTFEDSKVISQLGFSSTENSLQTTQEIKYSNKDKSTTWQVMPLASKKLEQKEIEEAFHSGKNCIWLGSNNKDDWVVDSLEASDDSQYFQERDSQDTQKYQSILKDGLGKSTLPECTRILEKIPPPDEIKKTYYQYSLFILSLAHGIPFTLLFVFYFFRAKPKK